MNDGLALAVHGDEIRVVNAEGVQVGLVEKHTDRYSPRGGYNWPKGKRNKQPRNPVHIGSATCWSVTLWGHMHAVAVNEAMVQRPYCNLGRVAAAVALMRQPT